MRQEITNDLITESLIPSEKMLAAIIRHFGIGATAVEKTVYAYMRHLCPEYGGGMWSYYELSNGGFYMVPEGENFYNLVSPNSYEDTMTSKEAGITACLFAFSFVAGNIRASGFVIIMNGYGTISATAAVNSHKKSLRPSTNKDMASLGDRGGQQKIYT